MLILNVSRKTLLRHKACDSGLALFDSIKAGQDEVRAAAGKRPRRDLRIRLDPVSQLWMATAYPGFMGWLVDAGIMPCVHGRGANLTRANLTRANLDGAQNWPAAVPMPAGWRIAACGCCVERVPAGAPAPDAAVAESTGSPS